MSFLTIPNRKIPAIGRLPMAGIFNLNKKAVKTLVVSKECIRLIEVAKASMKHTLVEEYKNAP